VCIKVAKRSQLDTKELYPEGKSRMIRVDAIRSLAAESVLMPVEARRKFIIIHEAERMNESACNALLKTLEEPSPSVIIVLLASNPHALAPTIISRCQRVRFLPVEADKIIQFLVSRHGLAQAQAETLAALCGGRPGQALRFLNDRGLLDMREKTFKVLEGLPQMSLPKALDEAAVLESITKDGETREKVETVLEFFLTWYRDLVGVREGLPASFLINRDREEALHRKSQQFTRRSLDRGLSAILESRKGLDWNVNARLMFQNLMIQLIEDPSTGAAS
jgi:DNA polymerase-3 subunit delta'